MCFGSMKGASIGGDGGVLVTMLSMHECSDGGGGGGVRCVIIIMKTTLVRQCIKFENLFF